MKIHQLEIENVKRVKAVKIAPAQNGLTIIGGRMGKVKPACWTRLRGAWAGIVSAPARRSATAALYRPAFTS